MQYISSGELEKPFYIKFLGWKNLHRLIDFILSPEADIPEINRAEMVIHDLSMNQGK